MDTINKSLILAFVGMPGAGKSIAAQYLKEKNYPVVRFGDLTDERLKQLGLERNPESEEKIRESIRSEFGMDAYAVKSASKIKDLIKQKSIVIIDGLYSWEEFLFLKKEFPHLLLIHIYAEPRKRYNRLAKRSIRPFTKEKAHVRDIREIEHLSKGGPIAMADYLIDNDEDTESLYKKIDELLKKINLFYDTN